MIITRLAATNLLKHARLVLSHVPDGLIAVSGPNESGKTSVVEAICFALFGRTFSRGPERIGQIIRWGESSCSVELEFKGVGDSSYTVKRSLDARGTHAAALHRTGKEVPMATGPQAVNDEIVKVCGFDFPQYLDSVYLAQLEISQRHSQSETIKAIAGTAELEAVVGELGAEIRGETQNIAEIDDEITQLDHQIAALGLRDDAVGRLETERTHANEQIDKMQTEIDGLQKASVDAHDAGVELQRAGNRLARTGLAAPISEWRQRVDAVARSVETIQAACQAVEMDSPLRSGGGLTFHLDDMQERLAAFDRLGEPARVCRAQLGDLLGERTGEPRGGPKQLPLPKQQGRFRRQLAGNRTAAMLLTLLVVAGVLLSAVDWSGWWLLSELPDSESGKTLSEWLAKYVAWLGVSDAASLKRAALIVTGITVLLLFLLWQVRARVAVARARLAKSGTQLMRVRGEAALLDNLDRTPLPELMSGLEKLDSPELRDVVQEFRNDAGTVFVEKQSHADYQRKLTKLLGRSANDLGELRDALAVKVGGIDRDMEEQRAHVDKIERDIADELGRREQASRMQGLIDDAKAKREAHAGRIRVRELAAELVRDTCRSVYRRFNRVLSSYTADVMPKMTEGRYRQLQVDDDLQVRVFSAEKNGFAELNELSSGTQRQILLAVRLAMSKALVDGAQQGRQYLIMDEPFAFFDRGRIRGTINALPRVDKNITQIWIIDQEFESSDLFDLRIECAPDSDELHLAAP